MKGSRRKPKAAAPASSRKLKAEAPDISPYVPLPGESELVCVAVASGASEEAMMAVVGGGALTRERFRAAFPRELEHGKEIATIKVAAALYMMAVSRQKGLAPASAIFWMKGMAGWSDGGGSSATVTVKGQKGASADSGNVSPENIIEVSFKIGDDSKIKDEG